ncbi:MAG: nickel pincer cofactor biosynthesis protein LarC [Rubrobacter sp.]
MGGAAGDMILAALVSAGAGPKEITRHLKTLGLDFELDLERVEVNGLGAMHATVEYPEEFAHRTFREIEARISSSSLPGRSSELSIEAFRRLAVAEGKVHGKPPEDVTFHEVGATDSIVDMVGSCVALELLGAGSVSCGPLPMGGGIVRSAHGPLPVPGPATLEVLKGSRVEWPDVRREMTTPTGAALMWAFTNGEFVDSAPPMTLKGVGYGAGKARFEDRPNLLRAVVGVIEGPAGDLVLLEANVDDATGEALGLAVESLIEVGAMDAWLEPITMKKSRGAYKVCAIVEHERREDISRLIMRLTGTLGVRHHPVGRTVAERRIETVSLSYGDCRVKIGSLDSQDFVVSPEYEDAARLSKEVGVPLMEIYEAVRAMVRERRERFGS